MTLTVIEEDEQQMIGFYCRCIKLQVIEVEFTLRHNECYLCEDYDFNWLILGHFPAVEYVYSHGRLVRTCQLTLYLLMGLPVLL